MIAKCRGHIKHYVNAGHSVKTPREMWMALTWLGGVNGVSPCQISVDNSKKPSYTKATTSDVNQIFVVEYEQQGMRLRKMFDVGKGRTVEYEPVVGVEVCSTYTMEIPFKSATTSGSISNQQPSQHNSDQETNWHCPTLNCHQEFKSISRLNHHISHEICTLSQSSMDLVRHSYSSRLWITTTPQSSSITVVESSINELSALPAGWALKQKREVKRFGSEMREWVKAHFINGERTGKKVTGEDLNRLQRTEFTVDEWRTATQFKSLLSRMSAKYRETGFDEVDETEVDVGGGIKAYEDAIEEAMELNGRIADIEVNNYVAVDYTIWCILAVAPRSGRAD